MKYVACPVLLLYPLTQNGREPFRADSYRNNRMAIETLHLISLCAISAAHFEFSIREFEFSIFYSLRDVNVRPEPKMS